MAPLLSICIPTYNRAHLLEGALRALAPQIAASGGEAELVVSDNASDDDTPEVVRRAQAECPIRYHRNRRNLGAAANILKATNELAAGEFAWVVGDDDLVLPDGVARLLSVLKAHREIDYVFVNARIQNPNQRPRPDPTRLAEYSVADLPLKSKHRADRLVERWEELLDPEIDDVFFGALMCSVVRLKRWRSYPLRLPEESERMSSLEITYPHSVILGRTLVGRKAYYLGEPCLIAFFGGQEWIGYVPLILLVRLQELLDLYARMGVPRERVERCRASLLAVSRGPLERMLTNPDLPGRKFFSLPMFLWRNRRHREWLKEWRQEWRENHPRPTLREQAREWARQPDRAPRSFQGAIITTYRAAKRLVSREHP